MKGKRKKRIRSGNLQKRMAWENLGRDKKRTILVILSLSLSIILTNTVFNFSNSVDPENAIQNMINFDFCIGQSSLLDYYRVSEESALSQSFIQAVEQQDGFDYGGCEYGCKSSYKSETTKQAYNQQEDGSFSTCLYGLDPLLLSRVQVVDGELNMEKLASGNYILEGAYVGTRGELDESSLNHSVGDQVQVSCNGIVRDFTVLAHVVANEANTYDWVGSCFFLPSKVYEDFTCNHYVMSYSFDVSQGKGPEMDAFLDEYTKNVEPTMTYKSKSTIMAGVTDIQNMVVSIGGTMAFIIGLIGISDISHQLKTPLAALNIYNGLLQEEDIEASSVKEFAGLSEQELDRIETLVQSLLKITKLDAGSVILEKATENVADMLRDVELHFSYRAKQEQKELILSGSEEVSLFCDRDWLTEAIDNIVKNALDHTESGDTVHITWKALPNAVQIAVKDNGCGIHPEDLHHIFKRFYRSRFSQDKQGIGLGLPLAKTIVEAHSGTIEVDSEPGKGTTFTMNFLIPTKL